MTVLAQAPYTPFTDDRQSRPPGLMPLDPDDWFVVHADFAAQMAYREALLVRERATVLANLPEGRAAAAELLEAIVDWARGRADYRVAEDAVTRPDGVRVALDGADPLETAGRLVADDLCLLLPDPEAGEYRLVAGVLCFPSRWLLTEKMGRPLTAIHDPVPDYDETLARRVNRVFEAIRPERPVWRVNWIVQGHTELFLPVGNRAAFKEPRDPEGRIYLRTERQTLRRLPRTGVVVFGIKTSQSPLDALSAEEAAAMRDRMLEFDAETIAYKGSARYHEALARLGEQARRAGLPSPHAGPILTAN